MCPSPFPPKSFLSISIVYSVSFMKAILKFLNNIAHFIFFPFIFIYHKLLDRHLKLLEKKIRREIEIGLSHELKTPLTSIYAYSEMLLERLKTPEDKESAEIIYKKSQEMIRLVNNMITISILDFNPMSLHLENVNLSNVTVKTVNHFKKVYPDLHNYDIYSEITPDITVFGDDNLLCTMIFELLNNAYLYRQEDKSAVIKLKLEKVRNLAILTVKDQGYGIHNRNLDRVFERFYRSEERDTARTPGLGIGLSLVKKATILMKGKIQLKSDIGKGTLVQIRLPIADKEKQEALL